MRIEVALAAANVKCCNGNLVPKSSDDSAAITLASPFIKSFEGCRLKAYPDPKTGGLPITIGWGSTQNLDGTPFHIGDVITASQADALFVGTLQQKFLPKERSIPSWAVLSPGQKAALLSFGYNMGAGFFGASGFETMGFPSGPDGESVKGMFRCDKRHAIR